MIPWLRRLWSRWKLWTQDPPIPFERGVTPKDVDRVMRAAAERERRVVRLPRDGYVSAPVDENTPPMTSGPARREDDNVIALREEDRDD